MSGAPLKLLAKHLEKLNDHNTSAANLRPRHAGIAVPVVRRAKPAASPSTSAGIYLASLAAGYFSCRHSGGELIRCNPQMLSVVIRIVASIGKPHARK